MNTALWIAQGILAVVFSVSAWTKGTWSLDRLAKSGQTGVKGLPVLLVRFIAFAELLGVLGLLLPESTGVAPILTPLAALGLGVIMILASVVHARLKEPRNVVINVVLLILCAFVVGGRA
ncbi:MAG: DoxX family protein [Polyangiales bacterium]